MPVRLHAIACKLQLPCKLIQVKAHDSIYTLASLDTATHSDLEPLQAYQFS